MGISIPIYFKGKEMWGHVDGFDSNRTFDPKPMSDPKPTDTNMDEKTVDKWEIKDAQIMS